MVASRCVVTSAAAAKALSLGKAPMYLQPFVGRARSVADAATDLGEPVQRVHYWVVRLTELGLLTIVDTVPRAGRAMKIYRSIGSSFVIPAALLPQEMFSRAEAGRSARMQAALESIQPELVYQGDLTVSFTDAGRIDLDRSFVSGRDLHAPKSPPVLHTWMGLNLSRNQAKQLQSELWTILQRYQALSSASPNHSSVASPYEVHVALAPEHKPSATGH